MPEQPAENLVQELLADVRRLKVENERLRLELAELRQGADRPDPRLRRLEAENERVRSELASVRSARDALEKAIAAAVEKLERK